MRIAFFLTLLLLLLGSSCTEHDLNRPHTRAEAVATSDTSATTVNPPKDSLKRQ